jgi:hypothetical protein
MDAQNWMKLVLMMVAVLAAALQGLVISGHFPEEHRKAALQGATGSAVLFGSTALSALAALFALYAARSVPWYALVIGAGAMLLAAPLALQPFPDRFVDGRAGPLTFSSVAAVCVLLLLTLGR